MLVKIVTQPDGFIDLIAKEPPGIVAAHQKMIDFLSVLKHEEIVGTVLHDQCPSFPKNSINCSRHEECYEARIGGGDLPHHASADGQSIERFNGFPFSVEAHGIERYEAC